jgi:hypothetical protein
MILEILAVAIPSAAIGAGIMRLLLMNKKIEQKIDRSERKKIEAMNDPEILLQKLNSNGVMVDDGDEISFTIEEKDGKKQLVQKIKKNAVDTGVPKVRKEQSKKKVGEKKGGKKSGGKKG